MPPEGGGLAGLLLLVEVVCGAGWAIQVSLYNACLQKSNRARLNYNFTAGCQS